ncbi:MAG TPA: hypothetical protein ENN20_04780 [Candidatus Marinimicrobia bacterium]|nr:hypothetical protein [Candidatus Neomarinimicrobiota bacterium]
MNQATDNIKSHSAEENILLARTSDDGSLRPVGLQVGEAVRLKVSDIDSHRKLIYLKSTKGKKDRASLLSENILQLLRAYWKYINNCCYTTILEG